MIVATMPASSRSPKTTSIDVIVERHRRRWLADAAAFVRVLDWQGLAGRHLAILDFEDVPEMPTQSCVAFTSPRGLFELVGPFMPPTRLDPGAAMFIGIANITADPKLLDLREPAVVAIVRVIVNAIAVHEYAHAIDFEARGVELPAGTTLATIFAASPTKPQGRRSHAAGWVRAYGHLTRRAMATPARHDHYLDSFRFDVDDQALGPADDLLDALDAEIAREGLDRPIVEILRSPAPAGFLELFNTRDAARSATGDR